MPHRKAYIKRLIDEGWTYQSIASVLGISRQAVESYLKSKEVSGELILQVQHLPVPPLPTTPIYRRQTVQVDDEVLKELKELHSKANLVRGRGKQYRKEAEDFTRLLWEQVQQGITTYSLAKSLGVTIAALEHRLVRYGYKTTNGKSECLTPLTHREVLNESASDN